MTNFSNSDPKKIETILDALKLHAKMSPNKIAFGFLESGEDVTHQITFKELYAATLNVAFELRQKGLSTGDRALLIFPSGLEFIAAFLGCLLAGVIAVPAFAPRANRNLARLQTIVEDCKPKAILTVKKFKDLLANESKKLPEFSQLIWFETQLSFESKEPHDNFVHSLKANQIAFLQYTSGSTGNPKGVCVTHGNIVSNALSITDAFGFNNQSIMASWLPHFHDMGLIGCTLTPIFSNFTCFFMPPASFIEKPIRWLKLVSQVKATVMGGPNFGYRLLAEKVSPDDASTLHLSSLETVFNGAEPIVSSVMKCFYEKFKNGGLREKTFFPCYGLAEATLFVSGFHTTYDNCKTIQGNEVNSDYSLTLVPLGKTTKNHHLKLVQQDGRIADKSATPSEVLFCGPSVAAGYWRRQSEMFMEVDGQPGVRTGDLGVVHSDGFYIVGRIKDLIILNGRNLYPQDIEEIVMGLDKHITSAAAFQILDSPAEFGIAIEVSRHFDPKKDSLADLNRNIRVAIAREFEVSPIELAVFKPTTMPKTTSGKLIRSHAAKLVHERSVIVLNVDVFQISEHVAAGSEKAGDPVLKSLCAWLSSQKHLGMKSNPNAVSRISDLGLDSLAVAELRMFIDNKFKVKIDGEFWLEDPSIGRISEFILKNIKKTA